MLPDIVPFTNGGAPVVRGHRALRRSRQGRSDSGNTEAECTHAAVPRARSARRASAANSRNLGRHGKRLDAGEEHPLPSERLLAAAPLTARLALFAVRGGSVGDRCAGALSRRPSAGPARGIVGNGWLRSNMYAHILDPCRHRLPLSRHEWAAIHREGSQVGEEAESGGTLRGLRRRRFAWNAPCGRSQDDRQGPKEGNRQGTARQDARRHRDRKE